LDAQKWPWTQKRAPVGLRAAFLPGLRNSPRQKPVTGLKQSSAAAAAKSPCSIRLMGTQKQLHSRMQILPSAFALAYAYVAKIPLEAF